MRKLILLLMVMVSSVAFGQKLQTPNTWGMAFPRLGADTLFYAPLDTFPVPVSYASKGWLALKGSTMYKWNGTKWITVTTDTTSLSDRINLKLNISDSASMLSGYVRKVSTGTGAVFQTSSGLNKVEINKDGTGYVNIVHRFGQTPGANWAIPLFVSATVDSSQKMGQGGVAAFTKAYTSYDGILSPVYLGSVQGTSNTLMVRKGSYSFFTDALSGYPSGAIVAGTNYRTLNNDSTSRYTFYGNNGGLSVGYYNFSSRSDFSWGAGGADVYGIVGSYFSQPLLQNKTGSYIENYVHYGVGRSYQNDIGRVGNVYGMYIESQKFDSISRAWGIYQTGVNDHNYFAGKVLINDTALANAGNRLFYVNGPSLFKDTVVINTVGTAINSISTGDGSNAYVFQHSSRYGGGNDGFVVQGNVGSSPSGGPWHQPFAVMTPNMGVGEYSMINFGRARSTYNRGQIYFKYNGSGSSDNHIGFGFWGVLDLLTIKANGNVQIGSSGVDNSRKFYVNGTTYITDSLLTAGKLKFSGVSTGPAQAKFLTIDASGNVTAADTTGLYGGSGGGGGGGSTLTISGPLTGTSYNGSTPVTIGIQDAAADGTTKGASTFTASDFDASSGVVSIDYTNGQAASGSTKGFLSSTDWTTFNNKLSATAPGNYGNIILNRNSLYTTPSADSLGYTGGNLQFKGSYLWTDIGGAGGTLNLKQNQTYKGALNISPGLQHPYGFHITMPEGNIRGDNGMLQVEATTLEFATYAQPNTIYMRNSGTAFEVNGSSVFNNSNSSTGDVTIKGQTDNNLLWTDASADEVYIGGNTDYGNYKLQVRGAASSNVLYLSSPESYPYYLTLHSSGFGEVANWRGGFKSSYIDIPLADGSFSISRGTNNLISFANSEINLVGNNFNTDVRIEGQTDQYLLFTDASANAVGFGASAPTAKVHIAAGTATAGTAPLKLTTGTALTTPEDGAMEYHGSHLYFTIGSTRYQLDQQGGSGSSTWGSITGTLSSQTDLQTALDAKLATTDRRVALQYAISTNANLTAAPGYAYSLPAATLTANRTIDVTALNTNGDYVEFYNNETGFVWSFTGATVYDSDGTTTVTELLANTTSVIRRINGKLIISKL